MSKRVLDKDMLDEVIRITRKFTSTGDADILDKRISLSLKLSKNTFGDDMHWCCITDAIGAAIGPSGMLPRATNQQIYDILAAYGLTVEATDAEQP